MTQKIPIPQQNEPFRRQSSLGGNVSFREIGNNNDNTFITMAKVTKVYYQQGRINFKLTNTNDIVLDTGSTNGEGSAPIPVDFFGRKPDGSVFGHYRPIKIGDIVAIGYVGGHRSFPIVLGVYPDSNQDYEVISPSFYKDGDDNSDGIAEQGLADRKVYPSMQTDYRSGSGAIAKALNGHSYLVIDDDQVSKQYDKLWNNYNNSGFFVADGDYINPLKEKAGDWLLIHEDNPKAADADNHRTRFYVNRDGKMQIVFMNNTSRGDLLMLEGERDKGFTITKYYGLDSKQSGQRDDHNFEPDLDNAQQYVKFNLGGADRSASIEATTKDDSVEQTSKLSVRADGVYINDKLLVSSDPKFTGSTIIDDAVGNSQPLQDAIDQARQGANEAKKAGDQASSQAQSVSNEINDMKDNMATYLANSADNKTNIPNDPNKSNLWGKILNNVYLDGTNYTTKMVADVLDAGTLNGINMTVKNLKFSEGMGNHISANVIDTGTLRADVIDTKSISADKLNIKDLSDITSNAGIINQGTIQAGDDPTKGVVIDNLDADNPDKYTPSKKAFLLSEVQKLDSAAAVAIEYGHSTGVDYTAVQKAQKLMDNGLAPLLSDLTTTTEFDHNNVIQLEQALQDALNAFHSASNSDIMAKIGKTANGKNTIYRGTTDPTTLGEQPNVNDMWLQILNDGTYNIQVWDGKQWINPGLAEINKVNESLSNLPKSYYQPDEPVDDQLHKVQDGDTWYKLTKDSNGNYTYVAYKRENGQWVKLLDSNYVTNQTAITNLKKSLSKLPQSYYSSTQPAGTDYKDGDIWYKISTNTTNNNVVYTPFKWNPNTNTWDPMLDASSSRNYVGSAPASPLEGDFWMDNTTLKQYQSGKWVVVPTQGEQGIPGKPGADGKTSYLHVAYAQNPKDPNGNTGFTIEPDTSVSYNYIGTYTDTNQNGSKDATRYTWVPMFDSTKKRNFTTQPTPPYDVGDTWTQSGATYFCTNAKDSGAFDAGDWKIQQLTIQSLDSNIQTDLNNSVKTTGNYKGVTLNDNGLTATAGSTTVAMNSNEGFLINNSSGEVFHVDTDGNLTMQGNITAGKIAGVTLQGEDLILEGSLKLTADSSAIASNDGEVVFNKNGISVASGNTTVNINGTNPLRIQNNNNDIFKVDKDGSLTISGNLTAGSSPNSTISGVNFTGDSLTLSGSMDVNGSISSAKGNAVLSSQGLSIKDGGLSISDKEGHQTTYISDDGTLTTNKGVFTGTVHAEQLDLTGDDASIDVGGGAFHVDSKGHVTAYDFTSTGAKITGGTITGGSLSIGKMNNGKAIDPITTNTFTDQLSWQNIYQRQDPKQYTAIPATYWATAAGHTVTFKANYSVGNYLTTPIAINNDDLQFGFRVHFIDKDNKESDVDVPIDTRDFYDHMTKTGMIIDAVQVPENTVQGSVYGYANIKAGSVTLGGVELSYTNPDYEALPDAFSIDSTGHVIANSIDVGPGGTIRGGTISGVNFLGDDLTLANNLVIGVTGAIRSKFSYTDEYEVNNVGETVVSNGGIKSVSNRTPPSNLANGVSFDRVVSYEFSPTGYQSLGYKNQDDYAKNNPDTRVIYDDDGVYLSWGANLKSAYHMGGFSGSSLNKDNTVSNTVTVQFGDMTQYASSEAQHSGDPNYKDWFDIISGIQSHPNLLHNSSLVSGINFWGGLKDGIIYPTKVTHDGNFAICIESAGGANFFYQDLNHIPDPGNQISLSFWANIVKNDGWVNGGVYIFFQGANSNCIANIYDCNPTYASGWHYYAFNSITVPNGTTGIRFSFYNNDHPGNKVYYAQPMVNVGNQVWPYMPTY